ncbi:alpha-1,3-arabinosyltransferase XAT3-like [Diospyros lotus]|uniref:alpha-1,3-arabinosyltransferase XAT3-like n=1 Tax=Diospyros lotus TaxID=55363 RepID=UPI00225276DD|nr:alpha-1,3-arabinosyltransferase XAT3-like [Diospyros lotus]
MMLQQQVGKMKRYWSISSAVAVAAVLVVVLMFMNIASQMKLSKPIPPTDPQGGATIPAASNQHQAAGPIECNRSHKSYDICWINGPTLLDPNGPNIYFMGPTSPTAQVEKIRPYPRKWDIYRMSHVKEVTLGSGSGSGGRPTTPPPCRVRHNASALVFSIGGYTGDFLSDFTDEFIPLSVTLNSIFSGSGGDPVLVISNVHNWWTRKYADLIRTLTNRPIINLDTESATHCFSSAAVGLIGVDLENPIPNSIIHFHELLQKAYGYQHDADQNLSGLNNRPRLVFLGRHDAVGREVLNLAHVKEVAEDEGFEVVEFNPKYSTSMRESYMLLSGSQVLVGVFGAGLIHLLMMVPAAAVVVQVVPIGAEMLAERCFGKLAKEMKMEYMEYRIGAEESSLAEKYEKDEEMAMVVKDAEGWRKKKGGWTSEVVEMYLKQQDVRLDLVRFRVCLKAAFVKARSFMAAS